jgi:hypothetical protein
MYCACILCTYTVLCTQASGVLLSCDHAEPGKCNKKFHWLCAWRAGAYVQIQVYNVLYAHQHLNVCGAQQTAALAGVRARRSAAILTLRIYFHSCNTDRTTVYTAACTLRYNTHMFTLLQYATEHPAFGAGNFEAAFYPCDLQRTCLCDVHSQQVPEHSNEFQAALRQKASH